VERPRGSILFLPGRGDAYEKYLETLHHWYLKGWRVAALDWRGQGGSGRLGADAVTGHVSDFSIWVDDLAAFWREWDAAPGPRILAGHSMGGHLVLRATAERKVDPDALILSAPMLGFTGQRLSTGLMHMAARLLKRLGHPARPAWKWSEKPGEMPASRQHLLTSDDDRYADELHWREARPELVMGPGSWGWVERAYASMRLLGRPEMLERIAVPVLLLAARRDRLVSFQAIKRAAALLPAGQLIEFGEEARHELLREADPVRDRVIATIDAFLARVGEAQEKT
jgi:lysophospholipase